MADDPINCRTQLNNDMAAAYAALNAVLNNPNSSHNDIVAAWSAFEAASAAAWARYNDCVGSQQ